MPPTPSAYDVASIRTAMAFVTAYRSVLPSTGRRARVQPLVDGKAGFPAKPPGSLPYGSTENHPDPQLTDAGRPFPKLTNHVPGGRVSSMIIPPALSPHVIWK